MKSKNSLFIITFFFFGILALFSLIADNWEERTITRFADFALAKRSDVKIPAVFPQDMPFINANLTELYTRDTKTDDITGIIHSAQSVEDAFTYYMNYGRRNGWQIPEARELKDGKPAKLLLQKNNSILSLAVEREGSGSKITVSSTTISKRESPAIDLKNITSLE